MSTIKEGRWACPSCGGIVLGRYESCPSCGAPRPEHVRFFLPEDATYTTDPALLADAASGVDWYCDSCGGANKGAVDGAPVVSCIHCGEARDERDNNDTVRHLTHAPKTAQDARNLEREARVHAQQSRANTRTPPRAPLLSRPTTHNGRTVLALIFGLAFVGLMAFLVSWFWTYREDAQVVGGSWTHTIFIDQYKRLNDSGFSPPPDAHINRTEQRVRRHEQVLRGYRTETYQAQEPSGITTYPCGSTDLGNGYFATKTCTRQNYTSVTKTRQVPIYESVPIYDTYAFYTIDRWRPHRTATAQGVLATPPSWPNPNLAMVSQTRNHPRLGQEREAQRRADYALDVRTEDQQFSVPTSAERYHQARSGRIQVDVWRNIWGGRRSLAVHP